MLQSSYSYLESDKCGVEEELGVLSETCSLWFEGILLVSAIYSSIFVTVFVDWSWIIWNHWKCHIDLYSIKDDWSKPLRLSLDSINLH